MRRWLFGSFLLVMLGCGQPRGVDGPDGSSDGAVDAGNDSGIADGGLDAGADADGGSDAGVDAGQDGGSDAGGDAGEDAGLDAGLDGGLDGGFDAGSDGGSDAGRPDAGGCWLADGVGAPFRVRAVAANLTSGNLQSYDPGEGMRILQGIAPDVVMIQEFNFGSNSGFDLQTFMSTTFDAGFSYTRGSGQIPNGVISRWPIVAEGEWTDPQVSNRTFTWARVDLPGSRDLYVVSVHLLTSNATDRGQEASALVAQLSANVPTADLLLVGGDLNTDGRAEVALTNLSARVVSSGPYPADQQGNSATSATRTRPYDWVLASPCLDRLGVPVQVGSAQLDAGLVVDTRVYSPISDLAPALATDSAAPQMQHMAVVREFLVQP